jgi:hypothetical protein
MRGSAAAAAPSPVDVGDLSQPQPGAARYGDGGGRPGRRASVTS